MVLAHFIYNLSLLLLCLKYGVRVETFQIFYTFKKKFLSSFSINKTTFNVGVIPLNSYVKIHGMLDDESNVQYVDETMLITKPKFVQNLIKAFPLLILTIILAILLVFMNVKGGFIQNLNTAFDSLIHLFKTLMGSFSAKESLIIWQEIKANNNLFILVFSTILLSTIISSALNLILNQITISVPDKLTNIFIALTSLIVLLYLAFVFRVMQTSFNLYGGFDFLLLIVLFLIVSYIVAILFFQILKILPKHKFV
jgi:hypothetical protein